MSEDAMLQQVVHLIGRCGVRYYAEVTIPPKKSALDVDRKLMQRYVLGLSKWTAYRRFSQGIAKVHYLRFERWGLLLATHGKSPFFAQEPYRDVRRTPIQLFGYSIGYYQHQKKGREPVWNVSVSLSPRQLATIRATLLNCPTPEQTASALKGLPLIPYAGIRTQLFQIRAAVNRARAEAGLEPLGYDALPPLKRKVLKVFA